jgi:hypothetical protein
MGRDFDIGTSSFSEEIPVRDFGRQIEVTPEMIEAGAETLSSFNSDFESIESAVIRIYKHMRLVECAALHAEKSRDLS